VEVYPAHVAGSLCGRGMNAKTNSTIGFERKHNPAVAPRPRAAFIADMNENLPPRPPNMYNIVERNRENYERHAAPLEPLPLDAPSFKRAMEDGVVSRGGAGLRPITVIDTRSPRHFGDGHIPGALHVYLHGSSFPTRVGFVASPESRLLLVAENERDVEEATTQLAVVGYDLVVGYLAGGMAAWQEAGFPVQGLAQISVEELQALLQDGNAGSAGSDRSNGNNGQLVVLDVRDQGEWDEGHIAVAKHIPYYFIEEHVQELDPVQRMAVICGSGQRSTIACSLLQRHGFTGLSNVVGGMDAWKQASFEVVVD
jgi:hydroxyacylglutathione hydrolase